MKKKKSIFILFDLDGVILNSEKNMRLTWNKTKVKFKLNQSFTKYKRYVGLPFNDILKKINIKNNIDEIRKYYFKISKINNYKLSLFPKVKDTIRDLEKKKIKYSIVTSKDKIRTNIIINKFKLKPTSTHCPKKKLRGKPFPDQLNECLIKNKINKKKVEVFYVGDTYYDYKAANNCKIKFIFAAYGFGKSMRVYKNKINNINQLLKIIEKI